jgi:hypothetical protein
MAGKLSDLRAGLAKNLSTIPGLRVAQLVPEQVNPPVAVLTRSTVNYHLDMRGGLTEWQMQVQLVAGRMADQQAQRTIDAWLDWDGDYSVRRAIESDQTLDGSAQTCIVTSADALTTLHIGDSEYLGVVVNVTVYA